MLHIAALLLIFKTLIIEIHNFHPQYLRWLLWTRREGHAFRPDRHPMIITVFHTHSPVRFHQAWLFISIAASLLGCRVRRPWQGIHDPVGIWAVAGNAGRVWPDFQYGQTLLIHTPAYQMVVWRKPNYVRCLNTWSPCYHSSDMQNTSKYKRKICEYWANAE